MSDPNALVPLGRSGVSIPRLALGTAPFGNIDFPVPGDEVTRAVAAALADAPRMIDTAPAEGAGLAEARLREALAGMPRDRYVLSTKVGKRLHGARFHTGAFDALGQPVYKVLDRLEPAFDFSYDGTMRAYEESLERLGTDRLDIVHIHDPDEHFAAAMAGAYLALHKLREEGAIGAISVAMNQWRLLHRFLDYGDFDCIMVSGRYTLLDRSAHDLLPRCREQGVAVIAGGVFNSGILANPIPGATYDGLPVDGTMLRRVIRLKLICAEFGVPLRAAALQFPLRHPAVAAVVIGVRSEAQWREDMGAFGVAVPDELWGRLAGVDG